MEIWVPEALVVFFLALPLFRPFVKALVPLDGLAWLPLIALGITIGIFPAYGFRPECLPILVFAFIYCTANLFRPKDSFRDRGAFSTVCAFILLGAVTFTMFAFSSKVMALSEFREPEPPPEAALVTELKTTDWITGPAGIYNRDYSLRIYGDIHSGQPLIFLVPPEMGSVDSVNIICTELRKKDYTVVSYTYKDNDPLKRRGFSNKQLTYWRIFRRAADFASINEQGKALETDRRKEIEFLLSRLPSLLSNGGSGEMPPIVLAGYSAGGSALAYLAGEYGFISRYDTALGVIAIESRLWSSYLPEDRVVPGIPVSEKIILRQWAAIVNFFGNVMSNILPQRVSRTGFLPNAGGLPVLYLVSGKALEPPPEQGRLVRSPYQAVFDSLRFNSAGSETVVRVALAAIESAGPLDYQDYPFTHPIYSFLLPGLKGAQKSENPISDTASIIANYASFLLGQDVSRETFPISGNLYVESKGLPDFGLNSPEAAD